MSAQLGVLLGLLFLSVLSFWGGVLSSSLGRHQDIGVTMRHIGYIGAAVVLMVQHQYLSPWPTLVYVAVVGAQLLLAALGEIVRDSQDPSPEPSKASFKTSLESISEPDEVTRLRRDGAL